MITPFSLALLTQRSMSPFPGPRRTMLIEMTSAFFSRTHSMAYSSVKTVRELWISKSGGLNDTLTLAAPSGVILCLPFGYPCHILFTKWIHCPNYICHLRTMKSRRKQPGVDFGSIIHKGATCFNARPKTLASGSLFFWSSSKTTVPLS